MIVNIILYNGHYIRVEGGKLPQTKTRCNPKHAAVQYIERDYGIRCADRHFKLLHVHKTGGTIHSVGLAMHVDYADGMVDSRYMGLLKHSWDRRTLEAWR